MMLRLLKQYYPIRNIFFVFGEGLILFLAVVLASMMFLRKDMAAFDHSVWFKAVLITSVVQICLYYNGLYSLKKAEGLQAICTRLVQALGVSAIFLAIIYFFFPQSVIVYGVAEAAIGFCIVLIVSWRFLYMLILEKRLFDQKVMIIGSGELAQSIIDEIKKKPDCGYVIKAAVAEGDDRDFFNLAHAVTFAKDSFDRISQISQDLSVKKIIVALQEKRGSLPLAELLTCRVNGFEIIDGNTFFEMLTGKLSVTALNPAWLIFSEGFHKSMLKTACKRMIDIALSLVLLILFAPLMALIAVAIKIDSKGPVFFSQDRVGQKNQIYLVHKFRSMVADAEKHSGPVWAKEHDPRITRVGRIIRKTRMDELPQLWNVFKGEMSFVGPRPEREFFVNELVKQIPYYQERFIVKPGITGWAQVSYGYGASVQDAIEKLNYDLFYIKNMSVLMDLVIVLRTVKIVMFGWGR